MCLSVTYLTEWKRVNHEPVRSQGNDHWLIQVNPFIHSASCQQQTFNEVATHLIKAKHVFSEFFVARIRSCSIMTDPITKIPCNNIRCVQWTNRFLSSTPDVNGNVKTNTKTKMILIYDDPLNTTNSTQTIGYSNFLEGVHGKRENNFLNNLF